MKLTVCKTLLAPLLLLVSVAAPAASFGYCFAGTVLDDSAERGYAAFSGSLLFDSSVADQIADASTASYAQSGAPFGLQIQFDDGTLLRFDSKSFVLVSNDLGGSDELGFLGFDASGDMLGLNLYDLLGSLFSSDALPTQGLTVSDFGWNGLRWESGGELLNGWLTAFSCTQGCGAPGDGDPNDPPNQVPEPISLLLAGLGLALMPRRSPPS
jgi:hypothetical protein